MAHYSDLFKGKIAALFKEGNSIRAVSRILNIPYSTARTWCNRSINGDISRKKGSGRRKVTDSMEDECILSYAKSNPAVSARRIRDDMRLPISTQTVRSRLRDLSNRRTKKNDNHTRGSIDQNVSSNVLLKEEHSLGKEKQMKFNSFENDNQMLMPLDIQIKVEPCNAEAIQITLVQSCNEEDVQVKAEPYDDENDQMFPSQSDFDKTSRAHKDSDNVDKNCSNSFENDDQMLMPLDVRIKVEPCNEDGIQIALVQSCNEEDVQIKAEPYDDDNQQTFPSQTYSDETSRSHKDFNNVGKNCIEKGLAFNSTIMKDDCDTTEYVETYFGDKNENESISPDIVPRGTSNVKKPSVYH